MTQTPELRHLRYFVALAEERHFGRAAARVGIKQPPFSQQIQQLERMLGTPLLVRRPTVRLTETGEALLQPARRLLSQADRAFEAARRTAEGQAGQLDVGFAASTLPLGLARAIHAYRRAAPQVELRLHEMSSAAQSVALRDGMIDIGVVREPAIEAGITSESVFREPFVAVLPPGHPLAKRRSMPLAALSEDAFVHFPRDVSPGLFDRIALLCRAAGFLPAVLQEAREWLTIVSLVEAGLGVTLAPASFTRLRWGAVRYVPLSSPRDRLTSAAICHRSDDLPPAAARFAQLIRDVAQREKGQRR